MHIATMAAQALHMAQDPAHYESEPGFRDQDRFRFNACTVHSGSGKEPEFEVTANNLDKIEPKCLACYQFLHKIRNEIDEQKAWAHFSIKGDNHSLDGVHRLALLPLLALAAPSLPVPSLLRAIVWTKE